MSSDALDTALLLLAFNRPDTTARVFEAIRKVRPKRLYIAVDGPRATHPLEADLCAAVRGIVSDVDWPCSLNTLFRDQNLGCKKGVSSAIDWFFTHEEEGIILEDDCLPSASFFRFCEELLSRFRSDHRVFAIQGNFFGTREPPTSSYLFSKYFYMWGWATWADRWKQVRIDSLDVPAIQRAVVNEHWLGENWLLKNYWSEILERQAASRIDSWGYSVKFHCFQKGLLNISPTKNLVLNIGEGPSASRTTKFDPGPFHIGPQEIDFPLVDPEKYEGAEALLPLENRWRIRISAWLLLKQRLLNRFPGLRGFARKWQGSRSRKPQ